MDIKVGEIYLDKIHNQKTLYPNKTRKYLLPCLKEYGDVFMNKLNNVFKVAVGIGDVIVERHKITAYGHCIFILLDSTIAPKHFIDFLEWIRDQPMYQDDYVFNNIQKSNFHMVILTIPGMFHNSLESFKMGEYSRMYPTDTINLFISDETSKKILTKDNSYKVVFVRRLNKKFGTEVTAQEWDGELDFKPTDEGEKFNHHLK